MEYARIIGGKPIQLNDKLELDYQPVIELEKPQEKEGYYIAYEYVIQNNRVCKKYNLCEVIEDEDTNFR